MRAMFRESREFEVSNFPVCLVDDFFETFQAFLLVSNEHYEARGGSHNAIRLSARDRTYKSA